MSSKLYYVIYKMSVKNTKHTLFVTNHLNENQLNSNIHERKFFLEDKHPASLRIRFIKIREHKVWISRQEFFYTNG